MNWTRTNKGGKKYDMKVMRRKREKRNENKLKKHSSKSIFVMLQTRQDYAYI